MITDSRWQRLRHSEDMPSDKRTRRCTLCVHTQHSLIGTSNNDSRRRPSMKTCGVTHLLHVEIWDICTVRKRTLMSHLWAFEDTQLRLTSRRRRHGDCLQHFLKLEKRPYFSTPPCISYAQIASTFHFRDLSSPRRKSRRGNSVHTGCMN